MHSPGRGLAVQGRGAQAVALADALASLRRTRARMASLTAYGKAGGRASQAGRASLSRHPGKLRGSAMSAGLPGTNRSLGLRGAHPQDREDAWELGKGSLPVGFGGPQKAHFGELQDYRKIPHSLKF